MLGQANLINCFSSLVASLVIEVDNHVRMYFDAKKANYNFSTANSSCTS